MDKIEFTKDEVQGVLNTLGDIPGKFSVNLMIFFSNKLNPAPVVEKAVTKPDVKDDPNSPSQPEVLS